MSKSVNAPELLMPKATAIWLVENTTLTFDQIGQFVGLHQIEVQALADEDVGLGIVGRDPIKNAETTQEELDKAIADENYVMKLTARNDLPRAQARSKGPRYTPVSKRGDKPDAIAWILKHHSEISDAQIVKLVGTTKNTINNIRDRSHSNISNIRPRHPVDLGLCSYTELENASNKGFRAQGKDPEEMKRQKEAQENSELQTQEEQDTTNTSNENQKFGGFDFSNFISSGSSDASN